MKIDELKKILRIASTSSDEQLTLLLDAGIELAKEYCQDTFENSEGVLEIPKVIQVGIAKFVEVASQTANVQTERMEGIQYSFFSDDATRAAKFYWKLYRKATYR